MGILMTAPPGSPLEQRAQPHRRPQPEAPGAAGRLHREAPPGGGGDPRDRARCCSEARKDLQLLPAGRRRRGSPSWRGASSRCNRENLKPAGKGPGAGAAAAGGRAAAEPLLPAQGQVPGGPHPGVGQGGGGLGGEARHRAPPRPSTCPPRLMIVLTGVVMGLILGVVLVFLAELFDTSMGTIEDVEELLQVPVLGVIPQLESEPKKKGPAGARARPAPAGRATW
ncbi:MAG: hypothetical protein MZV70_06260 [Desulfobacterales bacterium]|nr:hypothetical protein [Desulfobacterales bacterium]